MNDFRTRLGAQLGAAAARMRGSAGDADFRARFGVQLTEALTALQAASPARTRAEVRRTSDFRARLGAQLTAAAATLGERHERLGAAQSGRRGARIRRARCSPAGLRLAPAGTSGRASGCSSPPPLQCSPGRARPSATPAVPHDRVAPRCRALAPAARARRR